MIGSDDEDALSIGCDIDELFDGEPVEENLIPELDAAIMPGAKKVKLADADKGVPTETPNNSVKQRIQTIHRSPLKQQKKNSRFSNFYINDRKKLGVENRVIRPDFSVQRENSHFYDNNGIQNWQSNPFNISQNSYVNGGSPWNYNFCAVNNFDPAPPVMMNQDPQFAPPYFYPNHNPMNVYVPYNPSGVPPMPSPQPPLLSAYQSPPRPAFQPPPRPVFPSPPRPAFQSPPRLPPLMLTQKTPEPVNPYNIGNVPLPVKTLELMDVFANSKRPTKPTGSVKDRLGKFVFPGNNKILELKTTSSQRDFQLKTAVNFRATDKITEKTHQKSDSISNTAQNELSEISSDCGPTISANPTNSPKPEPEINVLNVIETSDVLKAVLKSTDNQNEIPTASDSNSEVCSLEETNVDQVSTAQEIVPVSETVLENTETSIRSEGSENLSETMMEINSDKTVSEKSSDSLPLDLSILEPIVMIHTPGSESFYSEARLVNEISSESTRQASDESSLCSCEGLRSASSPAHSDDLGMRKTALGVVQISHLSDFDISDDSEPEPPIAAPVLQPVQNKAYQIPEVLHGVRYPFGKPSIIKKNKEKSTLSFDPECVVRIKNFRPGQIFPQACNLWLNVFGLKAMEPLSSTSAALVFQSKVAADFFEKEYNSKTFNDGEEPILERDVITLD